MMTPLCRPICFLVCMAFVVVPRLHAEVVTASFANANQVPLTSEGYTATGNSLDIGLNYAPATGTTLMIVKNTALGFIEGTFSNLAQGQCVALTFGGDTYSFVANYYGGSGNDLVLQWADTRVLSWGDNSSGQLGNNSTQQNLMPLPVTTTGVLKDKTVLAVAQGSTHSLALCSDGTLATWGSNSGSYLGDGTTTNNLVPVDISGRGALAGRTVIAVAVAGAHNLALCSDGVLAAWGYNDFGQLGTGTTTSSPVPADISGSGALAGKSVVAIAAGLFHSLALCSDGTVAAWGYNPSSQLGNDSTASSPVPVNITGKGVLAGRPVIAIAAGRDHSLALCADGTLAAWGSNQYGQLGIESNAYGSRVPVAVPGSGALAGKTITAISAGDFHNLALCLDGTVAAWGRNNAGQLGNNGTVNGLVPVNITSQGVLAGRTVSAIAAGAQQTRALCSDGMLAAWGANAYGQLGDGSLSTRQLPVAAGPPLPVAGERFVALPAVGNGLFGLGVAAQPYLREHNARLSSLNPDQGTLAPAFASDTMGYLISLPAGVATLQLSPTTMESGATVKVNDIAVAAGYASQSVDLNDGDTVIRTVVTSADGFNTRTYTVTVRRALTANVLVASLGSAGDVPLTCAGLIATGNSVDLSLNFAPPPGAHLTLVKNTGADFIHGTFSNLAQGQSVSLAFGVRTYEFVANYFGGSGNDLVLRWKSVQIMSWGNDFFDTLGRGAYASNRVPMPVQPSGVLAGRTVIAVSASGNHTLALCSDGMMVAWGGNGSGQLGSDSTPHDVGGSGPVAVTMAGALAGKTVTAVATGPSSNLALCSDGTVAGWGRNQAGQLGSEYLWDPAYVPLAVNRAGALYGKTVVAISAGATFALALCSDGTVVAWGENAQGQLGNDSFKDSPVPVPVNSAGALAGKTVTAIAAGSSHSLVLCSDGTLAAWGTNSLGELGSNPGTLSKVPVVVAPVGALAGRTPVAISAGPAYNLVLCSDGKVAAWGGNAHGQLGNNSTTNSLLPVGVKTTGVLAGRTVTAVSAGATFALAQCADGTVAAWGNNDDGQLGNNTVADSLVPAVVNTTALGVGDRFVAAVSGAFSPRSFGLVASIPPGLTVKANETDIRNGGGSDFGTVALRDIQVTRTFTVTNKLGSGLSFLFQPEISGDAAADFTLTSQISSPLVAGGSTSFAITFDPSLPGQRTATVTLRTNDPALPTFAFAITGTAPLITKRAQAITFTPPAVIYLGRGPMVLSATSSSGLPVTLAKAGFASLEGNVLTPFKAEVMTVQATAPGNDLYNAAPPLTRTITIKPDPLSLTLINLSQTYDGRPKPVDIMGSAELASITYKVDGFYGPDAPHDAGSYPVKAVAGTKTVTGTLVIARAPLYAIPDDQHKYAGQANPVLTATYSGFVNDETAAGVLTKAPVLKTTATAASIGGAYPITASGAVALNYIVIYRQGTLVVDSFAGTYEALLANDDHVPAGKLTITVAATSKTFTAKLPTTVFFAPSFTGPLITAGNQATGTANTNVTLNKVSTPFSLSFTLLPYGRMTATTTGGPAPLGSSSNGQKISTKPVLFAGAHTAVFEPATPTDYTVPRGAGWATVSAGTTGILTFAGKLGDGTAFTTTLSPDVLSDPGYRLFLRPYPAARTHSFLFGAFTFAPHPTLPHRRYLAQQPIAWEKIGLITDATYRRGFEAEHTVLMIDPWLPPVAATKTGPALSLAQRLGLAIPGTSFGVAHSHSGSAAQENLPSRVALSPTNAVSVLAPATTPANSTKWKILTLVPATGTFTGSFELTDDTLKRPVTFSGVLRQPASNTDSLIGDGQYLLPTISSTEKTTGEILFTRP